jgi:hypothetical protein
LCAAAESRPASTMPSTGKGAYQRSAAAGAAGARANAARQRVSRRRRTKGIVRYAPVSRHAIRCTLGGDPWLATQTIKARENRNVSELVPGAYPIVLSAGRPLSSNRLWAIPVFGILVKGLLLIPHFVILYVLGIALGLSHLVIWIPVLFVGRYPSWGFQLNAGYVRWSTRIALYIYGITDAYPSFSMDAPGDLYIERPESSSRFFAIPLIGALVKGILLIPHIVILYVLAFAVALCQLVIWIPVLFTGQYPGWAFSLVAGTTLWAMRLYSYGLGLTDRYPPFSFS